MAIDIEANLSDTSLINSPVLELAAHPLNSTNPPPPDLPNLLDNLIASEAELRRKWVVCDQLVDKLVRRVPHLKQRLESLRQAHPQYRTNISRLKQTRKSKQRMCFETCEELYQRMFMQTSFMHYCLTRKTKAVLQQHMKAHKDIFDTMLGHRHDHRGIEIANSRKLQCVPSCDWYDEHGSYEWAKQPYTNWWWQEMNNTNWDWVKMRLHITDTIDNARAKAILAADMFLSNAQAHVPFWFWYEKYETWSPWIEVLLVQNEYGIDEERIVCKIRFEKTGAIMEKERLYKLEQLMHERAEHEGFDQPGLIDDTDLNVDAVGERNIDHVVVFNGDAYSSGFNHSGQPTCIGSWLDWWGYQKWLDTYRSILQQSPATDRPGHPQK